MDRFAAISAFIAVVDRQGFAPAAKLEEFFSRITSCRVVVEAPHRHHKSGELFHVRIDLGVPGHESTKRVGAKRTFTGQADRCTRQRHADVGFFARRIELRAAGKAAGRKRMTGTYGDGSLDGMTRSWYPSGGKELERDFDHGILQGARGWQEDGKEMTDGAAQTAALQISKSEDALLSELEAFVQLKIRQHAPEKTGAPAGKP